MRGECLIHIGSLSKEQEEKMEAKTHGGRRPGSGRYKKEDIATNRTLRVTDALWEEAQLAAEREGKTRTNWILSLIKRELDRISSAQD